MIITKHTIPKSELPSILIGIFQKLYGVGPKQAEDLVNESLSLHTEHLVDNLYCFIEYPYVDKVYRDSYYSYY